MTHFLRTEAFIGAGGIQNEICFFNIIRHAAYQNLNKSHVERNSYIICIPITNSSDRAICNRGERASLYSAREALPNNN